MAAVIRPRFGQPCFECGDNVPATRVVKLKDKVAEGGRRWLKSDLLCVECQKRNDERDLVAFEKR